MTRKRERKLHRIAAQTEDNYRPSDQNCCFSCKWFPTCSRPTIVHLSNCGVRIAVIGEERGLKFTFACLLSLCHLGLFSHRMRSWPRGGTHRQALAHAQVKFLSHLLEDIVICDFNAWSSVVALRPRTTRRCPCTVRREETKQPPATNRTTRNCCPLASHHRSKYG